MFVFIIVNKTMMPSSAKATAWPYWISGFLSFYLKRSVFTSSQQLEPTEREPFLFACNDGSLWFGPFIVCILCVGRRGSCQNDRPGFSSFIIKICRFWTFVESAESITDNKTAFWRQQWKRRSLRIELRPLQLIAHVLFQ